MPQLRGPDGKIVNVDDEHAGQLVAGGQYAPVSIGEASQAEASRAPLTSGALAPVGAAASSFLSGATLGLSDLALKGLLGQDDFERLAADREAHPIVSGAGQLGGMLIGGPTPAGALNEATAAASAGRGVAARIAADAAAGSIYNAGAYLSDSALGDRELSAEGLRAALGSGFEFGAAGGAAALGIEKGTIAARRMFSRLADGSERAANEAEQAWLAKHQTTLDANDAAADLARAKLAEAQLARQQAQLAQQRAAAGLADARAAVPGEAPAGGPATGMPGARTVETPGGPGPAATSAPVPGEPPEVAAARALRDRAQALGGQPITPEEIADIQAKIGTRVYSSRGAPGPNALDLLAKEPGVVTRGPAELGAIPGSLTSEAEAELGAALREHDAARADLDELLSKIEAPDIQTPARAVPVGEFGAPGAGGFKSQDELARLAAGSGVEDGAIASREDVTGAGGPRALRGGAKGTPVEPTPEPGTAVGKRPASAEAPAVERQADGTAVIRRPAGASPAVPGPTVEARPLASEDEFRAMQRNLREKLTPDEVKQSLRYSREYYMDVNRALRGDRPPLDPEAAKQITPVMDGILEKSALDNPLITHRGASIRRYGDLKPGDTLYDPGFGSTAYHDENIHRFGDVHLIITSPPGTRIAAIPSSAAEGELTLARGTSMEITGREVHPDGKVTLRARVVEQDGNPSLGGPRDGTVPTYEHLKSQPEPIVSAATDTLTGQLRGMQSKLGAGESLVEMGEPAREAYRTAKAERTASAAEHFRGKALAAREERAAAVAAGETPNPFHEPIGGAAQDEFFARLRAPKTRDAYVAQNIGRAMREEGSHAAALAKVEREWAERAGAAGHPLDVKRLEMAHDAALERVATAAEPAERAAAVAEARSIERELTAVGARPGAVEDIAAAAPIVTRYERASARLAEALGDEAPPAAKEAAQAFRAAEDAADQKTVARATRAIDDHVEARRAGKRGPAERTTVDKVPPEMDARPATSAAEWAEEQARAGHGDMLAPPPRGTAANPRIAGAKAAKLQADAALAHARAAETEAKIGATTTKRTAAEYRARAEAERPGPPAPAPPSKLGAILTTVAAAGELGIPGIPHPKDIPVIGPLLSLWTKYRIAKAMVGRFPGRVAATGDARAAALAARAKDKVAAAVDRTLGLAADVAPKARSPLVATAAVLGRRLIDDGEPDAKRGASTQELAAVRIREISAAASRPELVSALVRRQLNGVTDPDLIAAAEQVLQQQFQRLAAVMPKLPPPNPYAKQQFVPSPADAAGLADRISVLHRPDAAFDNPNPAKADALAAFYPRLFAVAQQRLAERAAELEKPMSNRQQLVASLIFRVPVASSMEPGRLAVLQSAHVAIRASMQPTQAPDAPPPSAVAQPTSINQLYQTSGDRRAGRM